MDEKFLEMADKISEEARRAAVESARKEANQTKPADFDGTCICGEEIPPARVALNYFICVVCQGRREERRKLGR